jgi:hypothetical protein
VLKCPVCSASCKQCHCSSIAAEGTQQRAFNAVDEMLKLHGIQIVENSGVTSGATTAQSFG